MYCTVHSFPSESYPGTHALQTAGSRSGNKVDVPARIHIRIATGSVNKMTGNRNNAAQMEKIAASTITGINNTNKNKTSNKQILSLGFLT